MSKLETNVTTPIGLRQLVQFHDEINQLERDNRACEAELRQRLYTQVTLKYSVDKIKQQVLADAFGVSDSAIQFWIKKGGTK